MSVWEKQQKTKANGNRDFYIMIDIINKIWLKLGPILVEIFFLA